MTEPTKVLYIAGVPHSGTTVISQILGQVCGLVSVGELYYLADAHKSGSLCGCRVEVRSCPFWTEVLRTANVSGEELRPDRYYMAMRELPAVLARPATVPPTAYRHALSAVIRAAAEVAGARTVVDSSKSPTVGRILESLPEVDLRVLHVVRSPAASGHSRSRVNPAYGTVSHALLWNAWNAAIEALWGRQRDRYLRIRYEDFADHPEEAMRRVVRLVGAEPSGLPFTEARTVRIDPTHNVTGNRMRFATGAIAITRDDRWLAESPASDRRTIERLTWPLRRRYGYGAGAPTPR